MARPSPPPASRVGVRAGVLRACADPPGELGDRLGRLDRLDVRGDGGIGTAVERRATHCGDEPIDLHVAPLADEAAGRQVEDLLARPTEYQGDQPPTVALRSSRSNGGPAPGIGDRVLAKTFPTDDQTGPAYTGRVMKLFEKRSEAVLGIFRVLKDGTFRIEPVERRQPELIVDKEFQNGAKNGDLVEVEASKAGRYGLPKAKVLSVLGSLTSEKAVSMIAIHAHDIPHIFPADVIAEADAVTPATLAGREDWRDLPLVTIDPADAKDHDDAVFATPDTDEKNPGGVVVTVAIADVAAYDGVWASACLLNCPRADFAGVLARIHAALKPGGALYASFKAGAGEKADKLGRLYNYPDEAWLRAAFAAPDAPWTSVAIDTVPGGLDYADEATTWLHVLARKHPSP